MKVANSTTDINLDTQAWGLVKQQLIWEFHAIIQKQQGQGLMMGLGHGTCWGFQHHPLLVMQPILLLPPPGKLQKL
jgi:hypothetical protein